MVESSRGRCEIVARRPKSMVLRDANYLLSDGHDEGEVVTIVSYAHGIIFLKTRKTAGSSVELWLSSIAGPSDVITPMDPGDERMRSSLGGRVQNCSIPRKRYRPADFARELRSGGRAFESHMPAHEVRQYVGERAWRSFLKITIERDPYERAVSMYRFKTRDVAEPPSLVEFLRRFPAYKLANAPIYTIRGEVVADVVLDYANLSEDVASLQRHLGVPASPLPRAKSFTSPARDGSALLGPEGCRIVESICKDDVALSLADKGVGTLCR